MYFKNLQPYRLSTEWPITAEGLHEQLATKPFHPCGSQDFESRGWVAPCDDGDLVHAIGNDWLICMQAEAKILPPAVINKEADARAAEIEEQQGFKLEDVIRNWSAYVMRRDLIRFLSHYELFKMVVDLPGSILELGVFRGASFFSWSNLLETFCPFDRHRKVFGFDTFEGLGQFTKEDAADYRYFPDPDLPPLVIAREWVEDVRAHMSELPRVMAARLVAQHGLPEYDATTLTQSKAMAAYFEAVAQACQQPKLASNWLMGEVSRRLNAGEGSIEACPVSAAQLAALVGRIADGTISNNAGKQVFDALWKGEGEVDALIEAKGLKQMNDSGALDKIVDEVLAANADNVAQYKAGKEKAFNALVGQVMKASKGKANPQQVNEALKAKLAG